MSGIYIPKLKKPTSTNKCKFFDYAPFRSDYCSLFNVCNGIEKCPIIEVPDHGRLIDADALNFKDVDLCGNHYLYMNEIREVIEAAPTIIPADDKDINVPIREEGE